MIKKRAPILIVVLAVGLHIPTGWTRYEKNSENEIISENYEQNNFNQTTQKRSELSENCQGFSFCAEILHNLGNSYFFQGKEVSNPEEQKAIWYQALDAYSGALAIAKDPETQHNYDEIAKLLGEPTSEEQQEQSQEGEDSDESGESQEGESEGSGEEGDSDEGESGADGGESEEEGEGEDGDGESTSGDPGEQEPPSSISESQQEQLEQYAQMLEQQQLQNQQFFNKENQANQNPLEALFGIPSLRQQIDPNSNQKDW